MCVSVFVCVFVCVFFSCVCEGRMNRVVCLKHLVYCVVTKGLVSVGDTLLHCFHVAVIHS